jgi:hypothetical protein
MFYIIAIIAAIFAMPAKALDGARLPAYVPPVIELKTPAIAFDGTPLPPDTKPIFRAAPLDLPPNLMAQANPGGRATLKDQLVGAWAHVSCTLRAFPWCLGPHDGIVILDASGHYAMVNTLRVLCAQVRNVQPHAIRGVPCPLHPRK